MSDTVEETEKPGGSDLLESADLLVFEDSSSKIVTARGTEDGLVLRIDGRASWLEIIRDIEGFLGERKKFFAGGEVSIEWLDRLPTKEQSDELEILLKDQYGIAVVSRAKKRPPIASGTSKKLPSRQHVTIPLFEEDTREAAAIPLNKQIERIINQEEDNSFSRARFEKPAASFSVEPSDAPDEAGRRFLNKMSRVFGEDPFVEDDANAKIVFGTLRSGQRVETPFSLVVIGDVNPGADLVAGGDIIIFGNLRGTAHAGAYDDEAFDKVIISLQMRPMQLRIGSVISRGSDEVVRGAEIARIDNRRIIVESFNSRNAGKKQR